MVKNAVYAYSYFRGVLSGWQGGKYRGRCVNEVLHQDSREQLKLGRSYSGLKQKLGCSRATIAKGVKES